MDCSWETTSKGKSTQRDARAAATHLAPQGVPALWRYDKLSHVCYDKWSHLPNCLSWLCSALVSGVAENVPGKNSGRFWENFLYGKRLPWADRQGWVRVCMPLAWSGHMDGSHQNVPVKNLRRFREDFLIRNDCHGEAHAKGCARAWGQLEAARRPARCHRPRWWRKRARPWRAASRQQKARRESPPRSWFADAVRPNAGPRATCDGGTP